MDFYTGVHINAGILGLPAEYHTVAKWSASGSNVVAMSVYGRSSLACERKDGLPFELTSSFLWTLPVRLV